MKKQIRESSKYCAQSPSLGRDGIGILVPDLLDTQVPSSNSALSNTVAIVAIKHFKCGQANLKDYERKNWRYQIINSWIYYMLK